MPAKKRHKNQAKRKIWIDTTETKFYCLSGRIGLLVFNHSFVHNKNLWKFNCLMMTKHKPLNNLNVILNNDRRISTRNGTSSMCSCKGDLHVSPMCLGMVTEDPRKAARRGTCLKKPAAIVFPTGIHGLKLLQKNGLKSKHHLPHI